MIVVGTLRIVIISVKVLAIVELRAGEIVAYRFGSVAVGSNIIFRPKGHGSARVQKKKHVGLNAVMIKWWYGLAVGGEI